MDQAKINHNNRTLEYNDTIQAEDNVNRDNIKLFALTFLSRPYAMAAAVGSLMILKTSKPAMTPASLVAWKTKHNEHHFIHCQFFISF